MPPTVSQMAASRVPDGLGDLLTIEQVAKRCQLSRNAIRRAIERRELRASKLGRQWRIPEAWLEAWIMAGMPRATSPRPALGIEPVATAGTATLDALRAIENGAAR